MEEEVSRAQFPGMGEAEGGEGFADEDSEGEDTKAMVVRQNRKGKKSGGFQSMGKLQKCVCRILSVALLLGFSYAVFKGVMKKGYRVPTPIQRKVSRPYI